MSGPVLHVIEGDGDVVTYLESLLEDARKGEYVACICATLGTDDVIGVGRAFREDVRYPFAMAVAMASVLHGMLLDDEW